MTIESRLTALETITGAITEAQNDKVDLVDGKTQSNVDYVVESKYPTTDDPTWYRVYKSGWVEQGGYQNIPSSQTLITLSKEMADTNYAILVGVRNGNNTNLQSMFEPYSTTQIKGVSSYNGTATFWEVKGMGA